MKQVDSMLPRVCVKMGNYVRNIANKVNGRPEVKCLIPHSCRKCLSVQHPQNGNIQNNLDNGIDL